MLVRAVHTAIYLVMSISALVLVYGAFTGAHGPWLWWAAGLIGVESVIFAAGGFKCPLTALAVKYGAGEGPLFDTFLPEKLTRHTFRFFGPLVLMGFLMLAGRGLWFGWN
ncbi:hypothetical protein [Phenylobacterium sp.]|uniref:hypothetical protein n=1 Tax=Phenylobacterium sp. TaxID=1871053 RepID=UPI0027262686|nr:hypothetical protein [Phenylobacterium sp.]MDO8800406.1 hypothetical protein [Phenylobacterium sp.]